MLTFTDMAAEADAQPNRPATKRRFLAEREILIFVSSLCCCHGADISTIHSFCKRLITEYFYKLDLDPTFSVIDADEARLLESRSARKNYRLGLAAEPFSRGTSAAFSPPGPSHK